jgi:hypothetical protein
VKRSAVLIFEKQVIVFLALFGNEPTCDCTGLESLKQFDLPTWSQLLEVGAAGAAFPRVVNFSLN